MGRSRSVGPVRRALRVLPVLGLVASALAGTTSPARAATAAVAIRDNFFSPREVRIDPGDRVVWTNETTNDHTVTSDERLFDSRRLEPGETFARTFRKEGYYFYHCKLHGAKDRVGMWGVVIVGDPPVPPELRKRGNVRPKMVVPRDFPTIQAAVDRASPRTRILIRPGVYREDVVVTTRGLILQGVDRFRTVIHGGDKKYNGILVDGANNVTVRNLTVRNYLTNGIFFNNVTGYTVNRVDAIKGRTYGIYAFDSYDGVIKNSFAWGSGDGGIYVGQCFGCGAVIENVTSQYSYLGYSGTNATGVTIRDSVFKHNGAGIVPNTLPTEDLGPGRGTFIYNNLVVKNNYETVPAAGFSEDAGIPFGTGVWLAGVSNNVVRDNDIRNHKRYGVLVSQSLDESLPMNNTVVGNRVRNSDSDGNGYGYDLAWDGTGANNCFTRNKVRGPTGPPRIQLLFACANRPFVGAPFPPVQADLAVSLTAVATRPQKEPPEPNRPRCQRGRAGCSR
ncbi:MAG: NosD domain-containing protein [Actinomycetota bacterium]